MNALASRGIARYARVAVGFAALPVLLIACLVGCGEDQFSVAVPSNYADLGIKKVAVYIATIPQESVGFADPGIGKVLKEKGYEIEIRHFKYKTQGFAPQQPSLKLLCAELEKNPAPPDAQAVMVVYVVAGKSRNPKDDKLVDVGMNIRYGMTDPKGKKLVFGYVANYEDTVPAPVVKVDNITIVKPLPPEVETVVWQQGFEKIWKDFPLASGASASSTAQPAVQ